MTLADVEAINQFSNFSGALSEKVVLAGVDQPFLQSTRAREIL
jgi:hypothetical protein